MFASSPEPDRRGGPQLPWRLYEAELVPHAVEYLDAEGLWRLARTPATRVLRGVCVPPEKYLSYVEERAGRLGLIQAMLLDVGPKVIADSASVDIVMHHAYTTAAAVLSEGREVPPHRPSRALPRLLVAGSSIGCREPMLALLNDLVASGQDVTAVLGRVACDEVADHDDSRITVVPHVPCQVMHTFMTEYDLVFSLGRGVMESLALGIPAIYVGLGYAGPVLPDLIVTLLRRNLNGYGFPLQGRTTWTAIFAGHSICPRPPVARWRVQHCCADEFVARVLTVGTGSRALADAICR